CVGRRRGQGPARAPVASWAMALGDYLAGEIAADFGDGLLTRREAVRRLGLLGLSLTAAGAVLAACGSDADSNQAKGAAATSTSSPPTTSATGAAAGGSTTSSVAKRPAETLTFPGPAGDLKGAFS